MILLLSPAKTLDFTTPPVTAQATQPAHLKAAAELMTLLRPLDAPALGKLLGISEALALLNVGRNAQWKRTGNLGNSKQAVLAFNGDAYGGLGAPTLGAADLAFAQDHLRILSGLYGCLRPLDLIQPYRLDMGTRLSNPRGKDLYAFWGDRLTRELAQAMLQTADAGPVLVNLASEEYFKAVAAAELPGPVLTPVFEDWKNGTFKVISFYAKRARGLMCRFAIQGRIQDPAQLKRFTAEGYRFAKEASGADRWVFRRKV